MLLYSITENGVLYLHFSAIPVHLIDSFERKLVPMWYELNQVACIKGCVNNWIFGSLTKKKNTGLEQNQNLIFFSEWNENTKNIPLSPKLNMLVTSRKAREIKNKWSEAVSFQLESD